MTEKLNTKQLKSVSTDVNLGNSDVLIPTQKAVKTYVDKRVFSVYEMPDAGVDYLGRALQYMGESDANYHHGYVYECVEQTEIETLILFNPVGTGRLGFDYANHNVMELFERIAAIETTFNAEDVVSGSFKLDKANELWYIDGYDANGNALFSNFTFEATGGENCLDGFGYIYTYPFPDDFEEGHEEGYTIARETHSSYSWERIDMQPNTAVWGLITGSVLDQTDLVNYIMGQISPVDVRVTTIESYIPAQASALNQLADKSFVNSSIATNTATFRGTYNSLAELEAVTADENDYGFVVSVDAVGNTVYNRYKYTTATTPASWVFEYALNNSSFTATQWAAINSNATAEDIAKIATALQPGDNVSTLTNDAGYLTAVALSGLTDVDISSLADGQSLIYDANAGKWKNVSSSVSVGFAAITGSPDDNVALKAVLDSKSGCILRRW